MGGDCDSYGAEQNRTEQERDHMENLGIDGKTLLTCTLNK